MTFVNNLMQFGLAHVSRRYYGIYRGIVTDNKDLDQLGRVKALCPQVGQQEAPEIWIMPAFGAAGNLRGSFEPPEVDDTVWVSFYEGDPNQPQLYFGGWYGKPDGVSDVPAGLGYAASGYPERRGYVTRAGHAFIFNDEDGKESVTLVWNSPAATDPAKTDRRKTAKINTQKNAVLAFDKSGGFTLKTPSSHLLRIDEDNGSINLVHSTGKGKPSNSLNFNGDGSCSWMHNSGAVIAMSDTSIDISGNVAKQMNVNVSGQNVSLNGGGINLGGQAIDFAVLGLKLIAWLATHTHGTGVGPSTPPLKPPVPADFLSKTVKVQA